MFGCNRYRCFEGAWLDLEGRPQGGVFEFEVGFATCLNTFELKARLDALHLQKHKSAPFPLAALVAKRVGNRELLQQYPLRTLCPASLQPNLSLVVIFSEAHFDGSGLVEYLRSLDNSLLSIEQAADKIYGYLSTKGAFTGSLVLSAARRGGIAITSIRSTRDHRVWDAFAIATGIE